MRIELIHPREIGVNEAVLWRAHQRADCSLASPFLTPDWARLMGEVRPQAARVAVIEGGQGFLPVQKLSRFSAMGLGAPISDYQGVVGAPDLKLDSAALCRALKVGRVDLSHVPETNPALVGRVAGTDGSWIVDVSSGAEAYRAGLKARRNEFVKQQGKKERKFAREQGELVFSADDRSKVAFEQMLTWKLDQLKRTGQPAIWAKPWVREALERTFAARDPALSGVLFTLSLGEKLVAANYFLRSGEVLHDWIMAHDDAFNAYSPGVMLGADGVGMGGGEWFPRGRFWARQLPV